jgi:hypothetical protein
MKWLNRGIEEKQNMLIAVVNPSPDPAELRMKKKFWIGIPYLQRLSHGSPSPSRSKLLTPH